MAQEHQPLSSSRQYPLQRSQADESNGGAVPAPPSTRRTTTTATHSTVCALRWVGGSLNRAVHHFLHSLAEAAARARHESLPLPALSGTQAKAQGQLEGGGESIGAERTIHIRISPLPLTMRWARRERVAPPPVRPVDNLPESGLSSMTKAPEMFISLPSSHRHAF
ncbi:hypothetical protein PM082_007803 [Marasmius tenuissimus]|nr:hypothetical protein PM082_007803 [Marasmius tenuissimus]